MSGGGKGNDMNTRTWIFFLLLSVSGSACAEADDLAIDVNVVGLFSDAAVLTIDGNQQLLKAGERSDEGVILVSANSREAVIEYKGRQRKLNLSNKVTTNFEVPAKTSVSIPLNDRGQYMTHGSINGQAARLLVDTGATIVAMNSSTARRLNVDYSGGRPMRASTAGGDRQSWQVTLDSVEVGQIKVQNVPAAVLEGDHPREILLGMTFLENVQINEEAGLLMLTTKY